MDRAGVAGGTPGNLWGGVLTEWWSWRTTLLINVPIGTLVLVVAVRVITADRPALRPRLDVAEAVLVTVGLVTPAYGVGQAADRGWTAVSTLAGLAARAVLLAVFVMVQARWVRAPLIPVRLLRIRSVTDGNLILLWAGACLNPMWYFLTLSMQTGLAFLPHTLAAIVIGAGVDAVVRFPGADRGGCRGGGGRVCAAGPAAHRQ
ncbi:hypothetical protein [Nocardia sienata]|uniref:hypothetical protein n=1 Tax=Nocardia sienata TaxID=248552 RepID=UPI0012ECE74A|nr:hypothetical protein [Nocardia sienata]